MPTTTANISEVEHIMAIKKVKIRKFPTLMTLIYVLITPTYIIVSSI
jgi:hypothetical protein